MLIRRCGSHRFLSHPSEVCLSLEIIYAELLPLERFGRTPWFWGALPTDTREIPGPGTFFASLFLAEPHGETFRIQAGFNEPEFWRLDPAASAPQLLLGWCFGSVRLRATDLD